MEPMSTEEPRLRGGGEEGEACLHQSPNTNLPKDLPAHDSNIFVLHRLFAVDFAPACAASSAASAAAKVFAPSITRPPRMALLLSLLECIF